MNNDWKVLLNNRRLIEGSDYNWVDSDYIRFVYELGPLATIQIKGPGFFLETPSASLSTGKALKIPGATGIVFKKEEKVIKKTKVQRLVSVKTPARMFRNLVSPGVSPAVSAVSAVSPEVSPALPQPERAFKPVLQRKDITESGVYLDYKKMSTFDYEWVTDKQIKFLVPAKFKNSCVAVSVNGKNQYFEVGRQNTGFSITLK